MTSVSWRMLEDTLIVLQTLDRYAMELDGAARAGKPLPDPPEGLVRNVWQVRRDAELALAVHRESVR